MKHFFLVIIFIISYGFVSSQEQKLPSFRFGISAGPSYQLLKINQDLQPIVQEYAKDLNSGIHVTGDFLFFPQDKFGLGIKSSFFNTSGELDGYYSNLRGEIIKRSDLTSVLFLGVIVSRRLVNDDQNSSLYLNAGVGAFRYITRVSIGDLSETFSRTSPGVNAGITYDLKISKFMQLGFSCSFFLGYIEYLEVESIKRIIKTKEKQSINRVDFSVGLRFVN